jgi:low affinity Fe/Cu permease
MPRGMSQKERISVLKDFFRKFSHKTSEVVGSPISFFVALTLLLVWAFSGPIFRFSDTWQLVINTATTIITFLMVFLIQNTQNRDAKAAHLKLDELIRSMHGARNTLVNLEELSDAELEQLQKQFRRISEQYSKIADTVADTVEKEIEVAKIIDLSEVKESIQANE